MESLWRKNLREEKKKRDLEGNPADGEQQSKRWAVHRSNLSDVVFFGDQYGYCTRPRKGRHYGVPTEDRPGQVRGILSSAVKGTTRRHFQGRPSGPYVLAPTGKTVSRVWAFLLRAVPSPADILGVDEEERAVQNAASACLAVHRNGTSRHAS